MAILSPKLTSSASHTQVSLYRSRLRRQAEALLERQKTGKILDNQQKRIPRRYQRFEAAQRRDLQSAGGAAA